jgi:hypothetical protein
MLDGMRLIAVLACLVLAAAGASLARAALSPEKTVDKAVLRAAQVGPGTITREIPGGRDVSGEVTLDLCGYRFRSEKQRVARLQLSWISNTGGPPFLSNEVVAYKPGGAARALTELRHAVATCPKGFVKSPIAGAGLIKNKFNRIKGKSFLPGTVGLIDHITEKTHGKTLRFDSLLVYQARGNILSAIYSFGVMRLPLVVHAATQSAKNLRALPRR